MAILGVARDLELAIKKLIRLELRKTIGLVKEEIKEALAIEKTVKKMVKKELANKKEEEVEEE